MPGALDSNTAKVFAIMLRTPGGVQFSFLKDRGTQVYTKLKWP